MIDVILWWHQTVFFKHIIKKVGFCRISHSEKTVFRPSVNCLKSEWWWHERKISRTPPLQLQPLSFPKRMNKVVLYCIVLYCIVSSPQHTELKTDIMTARQIEENDDGLQAKQILLTLHSTVQHSTLLQRESFTWAGLWQTELLIYLLKAYNPVNRTGSPQGFSQVQISHKLNTIQNMHIT